MNNGPHEPPAHGGDPSSPTPSFHPAAPPGALETGAPGSDQSNQARQWSDQPLGYPTFTPRPAEEEPSVAYGKGSEDDELQGPGAEIIAFPQKGDADDGITIRPSGPDLDLDEGYEGGRQTSRPPRAQRHLRSVPSLPHAPAPSIPTLGAHSTDRPSISPERKIPEGGILAMTLGEIQLADISPDTIRSHGMHPADFEYKRYAPTTLADTLNLTGEMPQELAESGASDGQEKREGWINTHVALGDLARAVSQDFTAGKLTYTEALVFAWTVKSAWRQANPSGEEITNYLIDNATGTDRPAAVAQAQEISKNVSAISNLFDRRLNLRNAAEIDRRGLAPIYAKLVNDLPHSDPQATFPAESAPSANQMGRPQFIDLSQPYNASLDPGEVAIMRPSPERLQSILSGEEEDRHGVVASGLVALIESGATLSDEEWEAAGVVIKQPHADANDPLWSYLSYYARRHQAAQAEAQKATRAAAAAQPTPSAYSMPPRRTPWYKRLRRG